MTAASPRNATIAYVAPFLVYVAWFLVPVRTEIMHPLRFVTTLAIILVYSRKYISLKPSHTLASVGIGIAVFLIWIAPDLVFGPSYRHFWLFSALGNSAG